MLGINAYFPSLEYNKHLYNYNYIYSKHFFLDAIKSKINIFFLSEHILNLIAYKYSRFKRRILSFCCDTQI